MTELSEQVKISLHDAQNALREALGFASKSEEPIINIAISQMLKNTEEILNYYEKRKNPFEEAMRHRFGNI